MAKFPRESDSRGLSTRSQDQRPSMVYVNKTTSNLDLSLVPEGMRYAKIAKSTRGVDLGANIQEAVRLGYRPVPKSRHPELCLADDILGKMGQRTGGTDYLEDKDHIFMEIPLEKYAEIENHERNETLQQSKFVSGFGDGGMNDDPRVYRSQRDARSSFGHTMDNKNPN